ncbi:MAG: hypothetical protein MJ211_13325 [Bacteroidales bacterium]|nr:hypothetical protein [Bacteroidales bacterium]
MDNFNTIFGQKSFDNVIKIYNKNTLIIFIIGFVIDIITIIYIANYLKINGWNFDNFYCVLILIPAIFITALMYYKPIYWYKQLIISLINELKFEYDFKVNIPFDKNSETDFSLNALDEATYILQETNLISTHINLLPKYVYHGNYDNKSFIFFETHLDDNLNPYSRNSHRNFTFKGFNYLIDFSKKVDFHAFVYNNQWNNTLAKAKWTNHFSINQINCSDNFKQLFTIETLETNLIDFPEELQNSIIDFYQSLIHKLGDCAILFSIYDSKIVAFVHKQFDIIKSRFIFHINNSDIKKSKQSLIDLCQITKKFTFGNIEQL